MDKNNILAEYRSKKVTYEWFCNKVKRLIEDILKNKNIEHHSISDRVKDEDSLEKKIVKKNKYACLEEITDIAGVRIITYYADTVDIIARIIEEEFEVDINNTIDKRKALDPDRFGYMSLHYVVKLKENRLCLPEYCNYVNCKIEIQIRTILQHTWAEIEHDLGYKSQVEIPREIRRSFSRLAGLLEIADREFCGIRNDIASYSKNVEEQMEQSFDDIQIDNISIEKYILQSKEIKDLNSYISQVSGVQIINKNKQINSIVEELNYLGYKTIREIDDDLRRYDKLIKLIISKYLANYDEAEALNYTIGLFYLCYAKIAQTLSRDDILDYLTNNKIGLSYECEDNADELLAIANEYINKK